MYIDARARLSRLQQADRGEGTFRGLRCGARLLEDAQGGTKKRWLPAFGEVVDHLFQISSGILHVRASHAPQ